MSEDTKGAAPGLEQSRAETRAAFENRALMYAHIYTELAQEVGVERATEIMSRAIHARGMDVGRKYRAAVEAGNLEEVGRIFVEGSPAGGSLFEPAIESVDDEELVLSMSACPLVDAWQKHGATPEEVDALCEIAAAVDHGTFESAGLELTFLDRIGAPGSERCLLRLRPVRE
jgi:hypothetical protein